MLHIKVNLKEFELQIIKILHWYAVVSEWDISLGVFTQLFSPVLTRILFDFPAVVINV